MLKLTLQKLSALCQSLAAITLALPGIALIPFRKKYSARVRGIFL